MFLLTVAVLKCLFIFRDLKHLICDSLNVCPYSSHNIDDGLVLMILEHARDVTDYLFLLFCQLSIILNGFLYDGLIVFVPILFSLARLLFLELNLSGVSILDVDFGFFNIHYIYL